LLLKWNQERGRFVMRRLSGSGTTVWTSQVNATPFRPKNQRWTPGSRPPLENTAQWPEPRYQSLPRTSPPWGVSAAAHVVVLIFLVTKRTLASAIVTLQPPEWPDEGERKSHSVA